MDQQELKIVGKGVRKKDAMALLLGKPAYVDDVTPQNCLVVKVLRRKQQQRLDLPFIGRMRWQNSFPICVSIMRVRRRLKTFVFTVLICRGLLTV